MSYAAAQYDAPLLPLHPHVPIQPARPTPIPSRPAHLPAHAPFGPSFQSSSQWHVQTLAFPAAFPRSLKNSTVPPGTVDPVDVARVKKPVGRQSKEALAKMRKEYLEYRADAKTKPVTSLDDLPKNERANRLWCTVNRYAPGAPGKSKGKSGTNGRDADPITLVVAHANGFHKETWEPTLARLIEQAEAGLIPPIEEIWALDMVNQGDAALINRTALGDVFDWADNGRDILQFLLNYLPELPTSSSSSGENRISHEELRTTAVSPASAPNHSTELTEASAKNTAGGIALTSPLTAPSDQSTRSDLSQEKASSTELTEASAPNTAGGIALTSPLTAPSDDNTRPTSSRKELHSKTSREEPRSQTSREDPHSTKLTEASAPNTAGGIALTSPLTAPPKKSTRSDSTQEKPSSTELTEASAPNTAGGIALTSTLTAESDDSTRSPEPREEPRSETSRKESHATELTTASAPNTAGGIALTSPITAPSGEDASISHWSDTPADGSAAGPEYETAVQGWITEVEGMASTPRSAESACSPVKRAGKAEAKTSGPSNPEVLALLGLPSSLADGNQLDGSRCSAQSLRASGRSALAPQKWRGRNIVLLGHSVGAAGVTFAASTFPHLFRALCLVDPTIFSHDTIRWPATAPLVEGSMVRKEAWSSRREAGDGFAKNRGFYGRWDKAVLERFVEFCLIPERFLADSQGRPQKEGEEEGKVVLKVDKMQETYVYADTDNYGSKRAFHRLSYLPPSVATAIIRADVGMSTIPEDMYGPFFEYVKHAKHSRIKGAGHLVAQEKPRELAEDVAGYLRGFLGGKGGNAQKAKL